MSIQRYNEQQIAAIQSVLIGGTLEHALEGKRADILRGVRLLTEFSISEGRRDLLAALALRFKSPFPEGQKPQAVIMQGAPGIGKGKIIQKIVVPELRKNGVLPHMVGISYDEHILNGQDGALFNVPGYKEGVAQITGADAHNIMAPMSLEDGKKSFWLREALWQGARPLSQNIRDTSMVSALLGGYGVVVDTTSSSDGANHLIEVLNTLEFERVSMVGGYAPFDQSVKRVLSRPRPAEIPGDVVGKRAGAHTMMPQFAQVGPDQDTSLTDFSYYYNPKNTKNPVVAFRAVAGQVQNGRNVDALVAIGKGLVADINQVDRFLRDLRGDGVVTAEEAQKLAEDTVIANAAALAFLRDITPAAAVVVPGDLEP